MSSHKLASTPPQQVRRSEAAVFSFLSNTSAIKSARLVSAEAEAPAAMVQEEQVHRVEQGEREEVVTYMSAT